MINAYRPLFKISGMFFRMYSFFQLSRHILEKFANIIFHENLSSCIPFVPHGRTDMMKKIMPFHIFV
jgi:hypothetical protein